MRALITGGHGFVGRHLAHHLVKCGDDVAVTYLPAKAVGDLLAKRAEQDDSTNSYALPRSVQTVALDVSNKEAVYELVKLMQPDAIYHLAALTFVPDSENNLGRVFDVNAQGAINLFDAVCEFAPGARVLYVSSAEVYGEPRPGSFPLRESAELRPISSYGVVKSYADLAAYKYSQRNNLHVVRVRPFPHIGPGQSERFAVSGFAKQLASIKLKKSKPVVNVGNLEVKRDYSDVSDIVRGYHEALLNGQVGEVYNLCSGTSVGIGDLLNRLIKIAEVEVEIVEDSERVRKLDISDLYGSYEKAQKHFGWSPRIDLEGTLHSLFAYWLETLS